MGLIPAPRARRGRPIVVGHRGALALAPENTLASFEEGLRCGAEWIELDVHFTRDGEPVVIHDATVDRTTDGRGAVRSLTRQEIRRLDAGAWRSARFAGQRVPDLEEAIEAIAPRAGLDVEIKSAGEDVARGVGRVVSALEASRLPGVVITARDEAIVAEAARRGAPAGLLVGRWMRSAARRAREAGAGTVVVRTTRATPARLRAIRAEGLALWVYTVNRRATYERFVREGADALIGDRPDRLVAWRSERRAAGEGS